jgi:hypothetical protein
MPFSGMGSGIARTNRQHVAVDERPRVPVVRRVKECAAEILSARPRRHYGGVIVAGRNEHRLGGQHVTFGIDAPAVIASAEPADVNLLRQAQALASHVVVEVVDHVVAIRPATVAARDALSRKVGPEAAGVQAEAVIATAPCGGGGVGAVDDERIDALLVFELTGDAQTARSCADDDDPLVGCHLGQAPGGHQPLGEIAV